MGQIDLNRARFLTLVYGATTEAHERYNIGTYKEKKLHLILKNFFSETGATAETPVSGFIADIYSPDGITEIQTSGFAAMRDKLEAFLPLCPVTLVYPVARRKWVSWIDPESGEISTRNRSPKTGTPFDAVPEMVYILPYLTHPNLTVRVVLLEMDEYRLLDGKRSRNKKRGSSRYERIPTDIFGGYDFAAPEDYRALLPFAEDEIFSADELCRAMKFRGRGRRRSAMLKVLLTVGAITRVGKKGNAYLYRCEKTAKGDGNFLQNSCKNATVSI